MASAKQIKKWIAANKKAKAALHGKVKKQEAALKKAGGAEKKKKVVKKPPAGYIETDSGLAVPSNLAQPVPASKLRTGFNKAKTEINSLIKEIASTMLESYSISEIELTASFSADGKFMGFGVGGAASVKIKIKPEN
jgi:hypothetical protein